MELSAEAILEELNEFEKRDQEVTPVLNEYLVKIAKTGNILHPWSKLKPLLKRKMELVIAEFCKSCPPDSIPSYPNTDKFEYERLKANILEAVDFFPNAPFTIQRLCELITDPKKHYNRTDKYMRGLEKNLLVVSTIGRNDSDGSTDRDLSASNDWVNSDSSNDGHNFNDVSANSSVAAPAVNGTVLENFASVFPSATRIPSKANTLQVAIVTGTNAYPSSGAVDDLDYEVIDSSDLEHDGHNPEDPDASKPEEQKIPASESEHEGYVYNSGSSTSDVSVQAVSDEPEEDTDLVDSSAQTVDCEEQDEAVSDQEAAPDGHNKSASTDKEVSSTKGETLVESNEHSEINVVPSDKEVPTSTSEASKRATENIGDVADSDITAEPIAKRRKFEDSNECGIDSCSETKPQQPDESLPSFQCGGDPASSSPAKDVTSVEKDSDMETPSSTLE